MLVVRAVDPASLPSDVTANDTVQGIGSLKGMPIVYLGTTLNWAIDSIATQPVRTSSVRSTALAASLVIKAASGYLTEIRVYSNLGAAQWIQVHDAASLPANGATPKELYRVGATSFLQVPLKNPQLYSTGIVVCNSTTAATLTVGAADCWFSADIEV